MPKFTEKFISAKANYHAAHAPATVEVDWDEYTKNPQNPDQTARAAFIYTDRLILKSTNSQDIENAHQYVWGDPEVMKLYFNGMPQENEKVQQKIVMWEGRWKTQNPFSGFTICTKEDDIFIGNIVLGGAVKDNSAELAYLSAANHHNKGYGKEYTGAVVFDWVQYIAESERDFKLPNGQEFKNIVATGRIDNIPSCKILENTLGFSIYKTEEKFGALRNHYEMQVMGENDIVEVPSEEIVDFLHK